MRPLSCDDILWRLETVGNDTGALSHSVFQSPAGYGYLPVMIMWCSHADHANVQRQECLASHIHTYMTFTHYQVFDYTTGRVIKLSKK